MKGLGKRLKEKVKSRIEKKDQLQLALDEALSKKRYFPKSSLLNKLAEAAMQGHLYQRVLEAAWVALQAPPKYHHRVMKGLMLIEAMIKSGPERCIEDIRDRVGRIRALNGFSYRNADRLEVGADSAEIEEAD